MMPLTQDEKKASVSILLCSGILCSVLFLGLFVPHMLKTDFQQTICTVESAILDKRYCCQIRCVDCRESYFFNPICETFIGETHTKKNLTLCLDGQEKFCAEEGAYCDNGYYCCEYDSESSPYTCKRYVKHRSCQLHCPTCYKAIITYKVLPISHDGIPSTYKIVTDVKKNVETGERLLHERPVGTNRTCWVDPKDSQKIEFSHGISVWSYILLAFFSIPIWIFFLAFIVWWCSYLYAKIYIWWMGRNVEANNIVSNIDNVDNGESESEHTPILGHRSPVVVNEGKILTEAPPEYREQL
jgi:hypothetical protein